MPAYCRIDRAGPFNIEMEAIVEYTVVSAGFLDDLIDKVNELIAQGWTPHGGVASDSGGDETVYLQALVR